ncbi:hypothetical protein HD554DRAFT_281340 [Boletus coccyginus]|nr:hypothetical protein HD554DRAFT_281340 [Boletus coccyginus]
MPSNKETETNSSPDISGLENNWRLNSWRCFSVTGLASEQVFTMESRHALLFRPTSVLLPVLVLKSIYVWPELVYERRWALNRDERCATYLRDSTHRIRMGQSSHHYRVHRAFARPRLVSHFAQSSITASRTFLFSAIRYDSESGRANGSTSLLVLRMNDIP